jgi:putative transposase
MSCTAANITSFGARSIAAKFSWAISPNGLEIMRKTALKYRAELFAREILPDHVHMLCEVDPQFGIHRFVKNIKGVTSHHLRKEFVSLRRRLPSLWTNSYFVSTVGGAPLEVISQYVENQKNV